MAAGCAGGRVLRALLQYANASAGACKKSSQGAKTPAFSSRTSPVAGGSGLPVGLGLTEAGHRVGALGSNSIAAAAGGVSPSTVNVKTYYEKAAGWKGPVNSALQGMILAAVGDVLAQYLTQGTTQPDEQPAAAGAASSAAFLGERYDPVRTLRLAGFGTWWGVMQWYWYNLLDHVQPSKSAVAIAKKVAANQLCLAPIGCFSVFAWMLWFAGRINELPAKLERDFLPTLVSCWAFWVPVASLNFRLVPLASQVGFMNSAGVLWNCYLSLAAADAAGDGLECACAVPHATPVAARA